MSRVDKTGILAGSGSFFCWRFLCKISATSFCFEISSDSIEVQNDVAYK